MRREKRIKVRLSESELSDLHILAERHQSTVAGILRDSVINEDRIQRVFVKMEDLQGFTSAVSSIDKIIDDLVNIMRRNRDIYHNDILRTRSETDAIDKLYGEVRRKILKKRQKVSKLVIKGLKKGTVFYTEPAVLERATTVSLTDEEYKKIRAVASKEETTLSFCMKAHAFSCCGKTYVIDSDDLSSTNQVLNKHVRFLNAIYANVSNRYIDGDDVNNILSILRSVYSELMNKKIISDTKTIHLDAKTRLKGGTVWQL